MPYVLKHKFVEAYEFLGESPDVISIFTTDKNGFHGAIHWVRVNKKKVSIEYGDWIVKTPRGVLCVCSPEFFKTMFKEETL